MKTVYQIYVRFYKKEGDHPQTAPYEKCVYSSLSVAADIKDDLNEKNKDKLREYYIESIALCE